MNIFAIDPGTEQSGWCLYGNNGVIKSGVAPNLWVMGEMLTHPWTTLIAIEMVASYGMPVGREVFETVRWIGRFQQAWHDPESVRLVYRRDVKMHLCNSTKAKDANVRQAIIDRFPRSGGGKTPQIGTKKQPGPLFGVSSHAWAALGVALTAHHQITNKEAA